MSIFATWKDSDQRFAYRLDGGQHRLSAEEHKALINAERTGHVIQPDPTTGFPTAVSVSTLLPRNHEIKALVINRAAENAITNGFWSKALGTPHQYSSQLDDQLNLTGAILRGLDMPYACRDEQGVKEFRLHTADQLRQVGDDFTLYKLQLLQHANELKQQLDLALAANDAEAMELITWEAPQP